MSQRPTRSTPSVPHIDTSVPSSHTISSAVPFTGISPTSGRRASLEMHRVQSFESSGGYFSGTELSPSPLDPGVLPPTPGPSIFVEPTTPGIEADRQSYETDELEGLAEDRVVAQGYLLCLKNVSGVRQWKRRWVVLRGRSLTLYKNFEVPFQIRKEILTAGIQTIAYYPVIVGVGGGGYGSIIQDEKTLFSGRDEGKSAEILCR